ncbi:MAG: response regulator [Sphingobacteriales bacterium]|nr:MAG: response regulator [Sphingobacteriales bacterium]
MKTVLLIEDNDEIRENTAEILELSNYRVLTAADGKIGVEQAIKFHPDLIVCDIMMPVLDGYGVIHMLQKNETTRDIPFIFLSAKAERNEVRKGMELGADDYITKPFNGTELLTAVESRLRKAELTKTSLPPNLDGLNAIIRTASGDEMLAKIKEDRTTSIYKKKQVIYNEGNHPLRLYYIEKGKVKTYKTNDDGKELVIGLYKEGDFLGYIALLEGNVYKETAEALEETELAVIPKEEFEDLVNNNREVMQKFVQLLARNITAREHQLLGLAYNSLRKKVAEALLSLYEKFNPTQEAGFKIEFSRENLATIAGTAKESLIRTLSDFKEEGLIEIQGGDISIIDLKRMQTLLN